MNVAKLSFKNIGYVWLAGTVLVCLTILYLFYDIILTPQLAQKEDINNQLQLTKGKVLVVENFNTAHPDTSEYLEELDAELVRVNTLLPDTANMGQTLDFLEETAKTTKVVIGALTTEKSVYKNAGWTETRVVFKVVGGYSELLTFVRQLDDGPRFMAVRGVEFHDRTILNLDIQNREEVEQVLEKEVSSKGNILVKPLIERGLFEKPNLVVMNVYLMVATQGRLPDAEDEPAPPAAPAAPKTPAKPADQAPAKP